MKAINKRAQKVNKELGVMIYNELIEGELVLIKYTKKQIKDLCIDDLIQNDQATFRLKKFTSEILGV